MKKLLSLMLALAMAMAMTACGFVPKGTVSSASAPEAASEPESGLEPGSTVGGTYENGFAGIGCELDSSWTCFTDKEILEMNKSAIDAIDDEKIAAKLSGKGTFYDMAAMSEENLASVNVLIENLGLLSGAALDTGSYIDLSLKSLAGQLSLAGLNVAACEKSSFDFCGKAADGIFISGTMSSDGVELEMFERLVFVKAGTYMFCITACTYVEDATADILGLFYEI